MKQDKKRKKPKIYLLYLFVMSIILSSSVFAFSGDLTDYIWADIGSEQINNSVIITTENNTALTDGNWIITEANAWEYCQGEYGYENQSICAVAGANSNRYTLSGEGLSDVTLQATIFDDTSDSSASAQLISRNVGDGAGLGSIAVLTAICGASVYCYWTDGTGWQSSPVARTNEPINFTFYFAPAGAYTVGYINGTKIFNDTTSSALGALRLGQDSGSPILMKMDNILLWSGTPENAPQFEEPAVTPVLDTPIILFPTADLTTEAQPLDLNVTYANATVTTIYYYINDTLNQTSDTNTTLNASIGVYELKVSVTDGSIFSENATVSFNIIEITPTLEAPIIIFPTAGLNTSKQPLDINVSWANSSVTTVYYYIDGKLNQTTANSNTSVNVSDGTYILNVSVSDGSVFSPNTTSTFIIDTVLEVPTITTPSNNTRVNRQPLEINVTFDEAEITAIFYYINGTLNQSGLLNTTLNVSDGTYHIEVGIYDGNVFSANASINFSLDTINPIITTANPTATSYSENFSIVTSCSDLNAFILNYTVYNSSNESIQSGQNITPTGSELTINETFPVSNLPVGSYNFTVLCSDSHTKIAIEDYVVSYEGNGMTYDTTEGNRIRIIKVGSPVTPATLKKTDRYSFGFGTTETTETYTFKVISTWHDIHLIGNSNYAAHLVVWNSKTMSGNWIDFESLGSEVVAIHQINPRHYEVTIQGNDFNFESIGGLNVIQESILFTTSAAAEEEEEEDAVLTAVLLLGSIGLLIILAIIMVFSVVKHAKGERK